MSYYRVKLPTTQNFPTQLSSGKWEVLGTSMEFAKKLDRLMKLRGQTQRSLAAALNLSHRAVGGWLSGAKPHRGTALLLAEYFCVPVEDLLDDSRALPIDCFTSELASAARQVQEAYPSNSAAAENALDQLLLRNEQREAAKRLRKVAEEISAIAKLLAGE